MKTFRKDVQRPTRDAIAGGVSLRRVRDRVESVLTWREVFCETFSFRGCITRMPSMVYGGRVRGVRPISTHLRICPDFVYWRAFSFLREIRRITRLASHSPAFGSVILVSPTSPSCRNYRALRRKNATCVDGLYPYRSITSVSGAITHGWRGSKPFFVKTRLSARCTQRWIVKISSPSGL
jgi:hypothetical protein